MLIDRRLLKILTERFDVGGDMQGLDVSDLADLVPVDLSKEPHDGMVIGLPRIFVVDGGGEEFEEAARGLVASLGDHARHHDAVVAGDAGQRAGFGRLKSSAFRLSAIAMFAVTRGSSLLFGIGSSALPLCWCGRPPTASIVPE